MNHQKTLLGFLIFVLVLGSAITAEAASSGTVTGYLKFYQHQGNYCPTTADCTGAKYTQSQYHTDRPFKRVKVYVKRSSDAVLIGQGTTNASGQFTIAWSSPTSSGNVTAKISHRGEQQDGRFRISTSSGGYWTWGMSNKTLVNGGTTNIGTVVYGSSAAPSAVSNLYDGAYMMWGNSLSQTNRMTAYFTNVEIRAWDPSCPTSCASGSSKLIKIDSEGSAYMPQHRVMHEMGHISSYLASRDQSFKWGGDYCYGGETPPCGWSQTTPEYAAAQFEEASATILSDVALYSSSATEPHSCLSAGACASNNIETSLGTGCAADENRKELNAERYHWDNYDSHSDFTGENLSMGVWHVVDTLHAFDNGTGNRQKDEPWNAARTSLDDRDGRCAVDFKENWKTYGTDSSEQLAHNCGSAGD